MDDKASRDWVDSTFEKLDREIREAKSKMLGQEEALKVAVNQLSEDVEGKLDRLELQPLKDYFGKKIFGGADVVLYWEVVLYQHYRKTNIWDLCSLFGVSHCISIRTCTHMKVILVYR